MRDLRTSIAQSSHIALRSGVGGARTGQVRRRAGGRVGGGSLLGTAAAVAGRCSEINVRGSNRVDLVALSFRRGEQVGSVEVRQMGVRVENYPALEE